MCLSYAVSGLARWTGKPLEPSAMRREEVAAQGAGGPGAGTPPTPPPPACLCVSPQRELMCFLFPLGCLAARNRMPRSWLAETTKRFITSQNQKAVGRAGSGQRASGLGSLYNILVALPLGWLHPKSTAKASHDSQQYPEAEADCLPLGTLLKSKTFPNNPYTHTPSFSLARTGHMLCLAYPIPGKRTEGTHTSLDQPGSMGSTWERENNLNRKWREGCWVHSQQAVCVVSSYSNGETEITFSFELNFLLSLHYINKINQI